MILKPELSWQLWKEGPSPGEGASSQRPKRLLLSSESRISASARPRLQLPRPRREGELGLGLVHRCPACSPCPPPWGNWAKRVGSHRRDPSAGNHQCYGRCGLILFRGCALGRTLTAPRTLLTLVDAHSQPPWTLLTLRIKAHGTGLPLAAEHVVWNCNVQCLRVRQGTAARVPRAASAQLRAVVQPRRRRGWPVVSLCPTFPVTWISPSLLPTHLPETAFIRDPSLPPARTSFRRGRGGHVPFSSN